MAKVVMMVDETVFFVQLFQFQFDSNEYSNSKLILFQ